jgi:hypothetical protein
VSTVVSHAPSIATSRLVGRTWVSRYLFTLDLDDVSLDLQAAELGGAPDDDAVHPETEGVADGAVDVRRRHDSFSPLVGGMPLLTDALSPGDRR